MLRLFALALAAAFALPAHAGYIYELTGHIKSIGDAQSVPDVLHAGDVFRATIEYSSTPGATNGPRCTDEAGMKSNFDFEKVSIGSFGQIAGGCMYQDIAVFQSPIGANGPLAGWGGHDAYFTIPFGTSVFPEDITDEMWAQALFELRLFGPTNLPSPVVQYFVVFDKVVSRIVPEPSTPILLALGLLGIVISARRHAWRRR